MPKMYSMKDIIDAWDQAYFEDLREEAGGFLQLLKENYGSDSQRRQSNAKKRLDRTTSKRKRKVKQSPKQKLLTKMTKAKWNKYKKGKGKKTYVQIRAEVSRSQAFKRKAKRL